MFASPAVRLDLPADLLAAVRDYCAPAELTNVQTHQLLVKVHDVWPRVVFVVLRNWEFWLCINGAFLRPHGHAVGVVAFSWLVG